MGKKTIGTIAVGVVLIVGVVAIITITFKSFPSSAPTPQPAESKTTLQETDDPDQQDEISSSTPENEQEIYRLLRSFGTKWVNYDTIWARNQSVRELLTENCIEKANIDVDPHADFESYGEITGIYKSLDNENEYTICGEENTQDQFFESVLKITVIQDGDSYKIDDIVISYVRQAF